MAEPLLTIGMFVFGLPRATFDELERDAQWRWGTNERFGARPASQFLGPGTETLSLTGVLVPELAGSYSDLDALRDMANTGEVHSVVLGTGTVLGTFRIDAIREGWRHMVSGGLPRVKEFSVDLTRVDDRADDAA